MIFTRELQRAAAALPCFPRRIFQWRAVFPHAWSIAPHSLDVKIHLFYEVLSVQRSNEADGTRYSWPDENWPICLPHLCPSLARGSNNRERAPLNDFNLLILLHKYPVPDIMDGWDAAVEAFRHHLWYFSEHLTPLTFFDDCVNEKIKKAMVDNYICLPKGLKHQDGKVFNRRIPLQEYVTSWSLVMFNLLSVNG